MYYRMILNNLNVYGSTFLIFPKQTNILIEIFIKKKMYKKFGTRLLFMRLFLKFVCICSYMINNVIFTRTYYYFNIIYIIIFKLTEDG